MTRLHPVKDFATIQREMTDSLPRYYDDSREVSNIVDREADQLARLNADIRDVLDQFFVDTATWGLAYWERICGIPMDTSKPLDQRRSLIKSKIRGVGTVNAALIKSVAESFANGEVEVYEYNVNKLPSFAGWTMHANVNITDDYAATLNATADGQASYVIVPVAKNTTYTIRFDASGNTSMGIGITSDVVFNVKSEDGSETIVADTSETKIFNSGNRTSIRVSVLNAPGFTGAATFKNTQLERGDVATQFTPNKPFTIGIKFVSSLGVPPNLPDIQAAIREILPAHLDVEYLFSFLTMGGLEDKGLTFGGLELEGLTFGEIETWGS